MTIIGKMQPYVVNTMCIDMCIPAMKMEAQQAQTSLSRI